MKQADIKTRTKLWWQCSCGNKCLEDVGKKPEVCYCGEPDWEIMTKQEAWVQGAKDWIVDE